MYILCPRKWCFFGKPKLVYVSSVPNVWMKSFRFHSFCSSEIGCQYNVMEVRFQPFLFFLKRDFTPFLVTFVA